VRLMPLERSQTAGRTSINQFGLTAQQMWSSQAWNSHADAFIHSYQNCLQPSRSLREADSSRPGTFIMIIGAPPNP